MTWPSKYIIYIMVPSNKSYSMSFGMSFIWVWYEFDLSLIWVWYEFWTVLDEQSMLDLTRFFLACCAPGRRENIPNGKVQKYLPVLRGIFVLKLVDLGCSTVWNIFRVTSLSLKLRDFQGDQLEHFQGDQLERFGSDCSLLSLGFIACTQVNLYV